MINNISRLALASTLLLAGCNDPNTGIKDTSSAYYGDFSSNSVHIVNLDKMSLEKTLTGAKGPYGLEPVGHNYLISLTRKATSVDVIDVKNKKIVHTLALGYQPREVSTNPSKTYTVISGRDIAAHTLINTRTGKVIRHYNRNKIKTTVTDFGGQNATGHPFFVNDHQYLILDRPAREIRLYHAIYGLQDTLHTETSTHHILKKGNDLYVSLEGSGSSGNFVSPGVIKMQVNYNSIMLDDIAYLEDSAVNAMGVHHINFHYDGRHIYTGSNNGLVYVIDSNNMNVVDSFESGKGGGHTDFSPKHKRAMVTNHKSDFITLVNVANPTNNTIIKDINVATFVSDIALQGHTQVMGDDENHFYGAATNDGIFFEVSMTTGEVTRKLDLKGELQQGFMFQSPEGGFAKTKPKFSAGTFYIKSALTWRVLANHYNLPDTSYWFSLKNQGWDIRVRHDGYVNLVNRETKKCLAKEPHANDVIMQTCNNRVKLQMWDLGNMKAPSKHIVNRVNNKCLTTSFFGDLYLGRCGYSNHWYINKAF